MGVEPFSGRCAAWSQRYGSEAMPGRGDGGQALALKFIHFIIKPR